MTDEQHPDSEPTPRAGGTGLRYARKGRGLEFDRVANFSDAVFAIALTLIAVELHPPALDFSSSATELLHKLGDMSDELIIFFVAFAVMGSYWAANHRFVAGLRGMDIAYVFRTLLYLAWVAFLPFSADLMGRYFDNPVAVSFFAANMALVSLLEWVLLSRAHRADLFLEPLTPAGYRLASLGSLSPVLVFLVSIPVMWINTVLGALVWGLNAPIGTYLNRHATALEGEDADRSRRAAAEGLEQ